MNQEKFFEILKYAAAAADQAGEFYPALKRDIDDMLRHCRTATGATFAPAPTTAEELEDILLCGAGRGCEWSRDKWLHHVQSCSTFARYPDEAAIKAAYASRLELDDWAEFEACQLAAACARIIELAQGHRLFSLAKASSPEAMAKGGTIAARHADSSRGSLVLIVDGSRHHCTLTGSTGDKKRHYKFEGWSAPGNFSNLELSEKRDALAFLAKHGKKISLIIH